MIGAVIATIPDLDVFIMPLFNEFQRISVHRGYSHSILFCLLGELEKNKIEFLSFSINEHLLESLDEKLVDRMKWFAQGFYTVAEKEGKIRVYNMQCDMQGVRYFGDYAAPTAFYYEFHLVMVNLINWNQGCIKRKPIIRIKLITFKIKLS